MPKNRLSVPSGSERDSTFELLRIISMILIVFCHFATHGEIAFPPETMSVSRLWWYILKLGGNFGVTIFVLISGYFLINSKAMFNGKKILSFWGQVFFYSAACFCGFVLSGKVDFSPLRAAKAFFPIISETNWFSTAYFILMLIYPFLNVLLHKISDSSFRKLLIVMMILWCIIPTFTTKTLMCNRIIWFVTLYCFAAYIRLYGLNPKITCKHWLLIWIGSSLFKFVSAVCLVSLNKYFSVPVEKTLIFYSMQSLPTFLSAVSLFMVFEKRRIGYSKVINVIASASFGVYLIHDNIYMRKFLWIDLFKIASYQDSWKLIPYSIIVVAIIYIGCVLIDLLRQSSIEKLYIKIINRLLPTLNKQLRTLTEFAEKIMFGNNSLK